MTLQVRRLDDRAQLPTRAYPGDAGLDLYALDDGVLAPGERASIRTGIAIEIPDGQAGLVLPRSGLAARHGITVELRLPPDGGVTAQARLPAALISAGVVQGGVEAVPDVLALGAPVPSADADAGLPRRTHRVQRVPGAAGGGGGGGETQHGPAADPALIARDRLASFQRGSRRAQADRGAAQAAQNR